MASNDNWPPVASPSNSKVLGKGRGNGNNKKLNTKEHKQQVLTGLNEMFDGILEPAVIVSVAHSCEWELQTCIDALINISASVDEQTVDKNQQTFSPVELSQDSKPNIAVGVREAEDGISKMTKETLIQQQEELTKFEKIKKNAKKNRMGSFRGSISKLESSFNEAKNSGDDKSPVRLKDFFQKTEEIGKCIVENSEKNEIYQSLSLNKKNSKKIDDIQRKYKNKSELCGLKVHYKTSGTETSSDDDDADIVIEQEFNTFSLPASILGNVSHFLSSSISTSTQSIASLKTNTSTTASPPRTPRRTIYQSTIDKIKSVIKHGDKILVIFRGLPGSGKSFLAKSLIEMTVGGDSSKHIFSTDDFYVEAGKGVYKYNLRQLDEAHSYTQRRVLEALKVGRNPIIIDNTNLQAWEMRPYAAMAVQRGYIVEILDIDTSWAQNVNELARKNTHGVPKDKIRQMMNRYERGLTGQKLCEYFGLKYPADNSPNLKVVPPVVNQIDVLSAEDICALGDLPGNLEQGEVHKSLENSPRINDNQYFDYLKDLRDRKESQSSVEDSEKKNVESALEGHHLLILGAIGSERKNSLVLPEVISSNTQKNKPTSDKGYVLSRCWDFTLMQKDDSVHSCETLQKSLAENQLEDPKFKLEIDQQDDNDEFLLEYKGGHNKFMASAADNAFKQFETQNFNNVSGMLKASSVIITEIFDPAEEEITLTEKIIKEKCNNDLVDTENIGKLDLNEQKLPEKDLELPVGQISIATSPKVDREIIVSMLEKEEKDDGKNSSEEDKDLSFLEDEEAVENKKVNDRVNLSAPASFAIGSLFNMIKTSILGGGNDDELTKINFSQAKDIKIEETNENIVFCETSTRDSTDLITKNVEIQEPASYDIVDNNPIAEIRAAMNSTDSDPVIDLESLEIDAIKMIINNNTEAITQVVKKNEAISDPIPFINVGKIEADYVNNMNRITWKESPFPVADIKFSQVNCEETQVRDVLMVDSETNTTHFDFNIAYSGEANNSGYRILKAGNKRIDDRITHSLSVQSVRSPAKLMLDKSSMTGGIFSRDGNPDLEEEEEKKDRLPKLMELFPHIPKDYVLEIYEKSEKNFPWTVELLLEGASEYIPWNFSKEKDSKENLSDAEDSEEVVSDPSSAEIIIKDDENDQVVIAEEQKPSASSSSLPGNSHQIKSGRSVSRSSTSPSENEKSNDPDQTIELNLGFDFIQVLERQFGENDPSVPDGFLPVIQIKKSMVEELYALWIESMSQQLSARQELLEQMIAKDAEFARKFEKEQELKLEKSQTPPAPSVPNLDDIMDMEMALARVENERKSIFIRETTENMASRLSRQVLNESQSNVDFDMFDDILRSHRGNFKDTFLTIEENTGKPIATCDTLGKQKTLIQRVKDESASGSKGTLNIPKLIIRDPKQDAISYKAAVANAKNIRREAQRELSLRIENINKAQEMYRKGYPEVAAYYSNVARLHSQNIEIANAEAVSTIVKAQSWKCADTLDLHYLFVAEALQVVEEFLDYHIEKLIKSTKKSTTVSIITGWGARSNSGTSKIKPAVIRYLSRHNIKFSEENLGCLRVKLHRKHRVTG